jgi:hypothetical protein
MTDIFWGEPIAVDGKRPDWLNDDGRTVDASFRGKWIGDVDGNIKNVNDWWWPDIDAIRLPADHFAYKAIAAGFVPWGGGDEAPADWDGGEALFECEQAWEPQLRSWATAGLIIGYRRRTEQPANADTVTVQRNTAEAWQELFDQRGAIPALRALGLIREPTEAERIAADTDIDLATVERVLAARA